MMRFSLRLLTGGMIALLAQVANGQPQVIFHDSFEDPPVGAGMTNWAKWEDLSWSGSAPMCTNSPKNCFGPHMLDQDPEVFYSGAKSAKATRAQPYWYAAVRDEYDSLIDRSQVIRLSGYQFEIFFKQEPFPPDN